MRDLHSNPAAGATADLRRCNDCGRWNRVDPARLGPSCGACGRALQTPIEAASREDVTPYRMPGWALPRGWLRQALSWATPVRCATQAAPTIGHRRRAVQLCRIATAIYLASLLALWWTMTQIGERWWLSSILLYLPRLLYGLPILPLALLAGLTERRLLPIHAASLLLLLGPVMGWHAPGRGEAPPPDVAPLRVLTYNVGCLPWALIALQRVVAETHPTIVAVQETRDLKHLFPGWTTHYTGEYFLATRLRVLETEDRPLLSGMPWRRGMRYRLEGPRGPLNLFSLHLDTPRRAFDEIKAPKWRLVRWRNLPAAQRILRADADRRAREAATARAWITATSGPCIIAGDFNQPPDSPLYRTLWANFRDAFAVAGAGYGYTAHAPYPWIRIDRILTTPEWRIQRAWNPRGSGRDHVPLVADVWLAGDRDSATPR